MFPRLRKLAPNCGLGSRKLRKCASNERSLYVQPADHELEKGRSEKRQHQNPEAPPLILGLLPALSLP